MCCECDLCGSCPAVAAEGLGGGGAGEVAGGPASPHHGVRVLGSLGSLGRAVELDTCGDQSVDWVIWRLVTGDHAAGAAGEAAGRGRGRGQAPVQEGGHQPREDVALAVTSPEEKYSLFSAQTRRLSFYFIPP